MALSTDKLVPRARAPMTLLNNPIASSCTCMQRGSYYHQTCALSKNFCFVLSLVLYHPSPQALSASSTLHPHILASILFYTIILGCVITALLFVYPLPVHTDTASCALQLTSLVSCC